MKQKLFIGSSKGALPLCLAVQLELRDEFDVTVWNQGVFRLSHDALDSLLDMLDRSDAGSLFSAATISPPGGG
jgi:predicted nucleotide-binding protein